MWGTELKWLYGVQSVTHRNSGLPLKPETPASFPPTPLPRPASPDRTSSVSHEDSFLLARKVLSHRQIQGDTQSEADF